RQLFWNLIGNALKFTPDGGQVSIRSWDSNERVGVHVENSGGRRTAAQIARIFEPFEQSGGHSGENQRQGLGLGLAIARGIPELHDARSAASSAGRDHGARFVVDLPTVAVAVSKGQNPSRAPVRADNAKV